MSIAHSYDPDRLPIFKNGKLRFLFEDYQFIEPDERIQAEPETAPKCDQRKEMRKAIISAVRAMPDRTANIIAESLEFDNQLVYRELERLVIEGKLESFKRQGKKMLTLYRIPQYKLGGKVLSFREMAKSERNVHGLCWQAIQKRIRSGMTPAEALSIAPTKKGELGKALEIERDDSPLPLILTGKK